VHIEDRKRSVTGVREQVLDDVDICLRAEVPLVRSSSREDVGVYFLGRLSWSNVIYYGMGPLECGDAAEANILEREFGVGCWEWTQRFC